MATASDMQQYLDDGCVEAIIKPLLQRLLTEKPEEPIAFIIKDLCSQYPNRAGKAIAALNKVSEHFYYTIIIKLNLLLSSFHVAFLH
jgi:hypothetical protein